MKKKVSKTKAPLIDGVWRNINIAGEAINWAASATWFAVTALTIVFAGGSGWLGAISTCIIHGAVALLLRHLRKL